ncbi:MAG: hypothetical protein KF777_16345 [Planctomycetaceae bacterium]|nr:hypothetical protein [Planctomycetaceae bacterium]
MNRSSVRNNRCELLQLAIVLVVLFFYWVFCELTYFASMQPDGVKTVDDYWKRFGEPPHVYEIVKDDGTYYMVFGRLPPFWSVVVPSSPPTYVFDENGVFVDWCADKGDGPEEYNRSWPLGNRVEPAEFLARLKHQ